MNAWKTIAAVAVLFAAAGVGAAFAPVAHGQGDRPQDRAVARVVEAFGGQGSRIGVSVREVEDEDLKTAKLTAPGGVVIDDVTEDGPAAKAGLKRGDVVVEFDGERVRGTRQFTRLVQETPAGRKVATVVLRNGQRSTLTVEPREGSRMRYLGDFDRFDDFGGSWRLLPPPPAAPAPPAPPDAPAPPIPPAPRLFEFFDLPGRAGGRLGITITELSPQLAEYFGTKAGVLVSSVSDASSAAKAGLKAGDVVTAFNGSKVDLPSELRRLIGRMDDGAEFTIEVVRDRKPLTLKGKLEDRERRRSTVRTIL